ncbi:NAD-dependent protein deacetylase sirtuin-1-like [Glandiceps talaboti]
MADDVGRLFPISPPKRPKFDDDVNNLKEDTLKYGECTNEQSFQEDTGHFRAIGLISAENHAIVNDGQQGEKQTATHEKMSESDLLPVSSDHSTHDMIPCEPSCSQYTKDTPSTARCGSDSGSTSSDSDDSLDFHLGFLDPELKGGPMGWVQQQMLSGVNPQDILTKMIPDGATLPTELDEVTMWKIIISILGEPPRRKKLKDINTFDDVLHLLRTKSKIMVLTGAGVSVSCGIPDFRSRDGIYARLAVDFPDLPDPQAMFDISYFWRNPRPFYKFAKEIYPGQFQPSMSHKFIGLLEKHNKLLRNYTQNIDTLEQAANISRVVQCHGSFATASCTRCKYQVDCETIRDDIFNQVVPQCPRCPLSSDPSELAVMKPDIVFFGEGLSASFHKGLDEDREELDLLIVIGSSLKVRPVALIPHSIPGNIPQILINREPLPHMSFDVELLGDCDGIINELCHRLGNGWNHLCTSQEPLTETTEIPRELYENMSTPPLYVDTDTQSTLFDDSSETGDAWEPQQNMAKEQNSAASIQTVRPEVGTDKPNYATEKEASPPGDVKQDTMCEDKGLKMEESSSNVIPMPPLHKKPRNLSIASYLTENKYMYVPPSRYVFKGAEVYLDQLYVPSESESESDQNSRSSEDSSVAEKDYVMTAGNTTLAAGTTPMAVVSTTSVLGATPLAARNTTSVMDATKVDNTLLAAGNTAAPADVTTGNTTLAVGATTSAKDDTTWTESNTTLTTCANSSGVGDTNLVVGKTALTAYASSPCVGDTTSTVGNTTLTECAISSEVNDTIGKSTFTVRDATLTAGNVKTSELPSTLLQSENRNPDTVPKTQSPSGKTTQNKIQNCSNAENNPEFDS